MQARNTFTSLSPGTTSAVIMPSATQSRIVLCLSIANALELPPESIFRKAGLLPPNPDVDEEIEQILHEVEKLPKSDQEEVLAFIRMKRNLRKKGK